MSRRWSPDCILLDFHLPDMDGLEVLLRLRGENDRPPCAIVMLTACGGEELAVKAMKSGAMDYLPKGQVTAEVLVHTALNAIERFQMLQRIDEQKIRGGTGCTTVSEPVERHPSNGLDGKRGRTAQSTRTANGWTTPGRASKRPARSGWDELLHPEDRERTLSAWTQARQAGSVFEIEHRLRRASDGSFRWHLVRAIPFRDESGEVTNWFGTCTEIENQKQAEAVNLQNEKLQSIGQLAAGIAHEFNNLLVIILGGASRVTGESSALAPFARHVAGA